MTTPSDLGCTAMLDSVEITPTQLKGQEAELISRLPLGTEVFVPCLPRADFDATVCACDQLAQWGLTPVPHIAARRFASVDELAIAFGKLRQVRVEALFVIGGDTTRPAGSILSSLDVLGSGLIDEYGFARVGFAGYPEGHPHISEETLNRVMLEKLSQVGSMKASCFLVTQFGFTVDPIARWLDARATSAWTAPLRIAIPGPARVRTLLSFASQCGVVASLKGLSNRPDARAAWLSGWTPDSLIGALAERRLAYAGRLDVGWHWLSFGGLSPVLNYMNKAQRMSDFSRDAIA